MSKIRVLNKKSMTMIKVEKPDSTKLEEIKQWKTWEKEPGAFEHDQQRTEAFFIIEGNATLSTNSSGTVDISSGDLVTVESGQIVNWHIHETIKKHFIFFD